MQEIFRKLSRGTIAFLCISIAIIVILANDPPHNLCQSEKNQFLKVQNEFLNPAPALKKVFKKAKSPYERLYASCKEAENSGGCLEFFIKIRAFVSDYEVSSAECREDVFSESKIEKIFKKSLELMLNLAWGKAAPTEFQKKYAWFDQTDISLFCRTKNLIEQSMSESQWENYREDTLQDLPGAENLSREELWKSSLLSTSCQEFL